CNCERRSDRSVCRLHLILAKGGIVSIRRQAFEARSFSEGGGAIPSDEATMDIGSILINKIAVRSCRNRSRCYGWTGGADAAGSAVNCRARRDVVVFATPRLELAQGRIEREGEKLRSRSGIQRIDDSGRHGVRSIVENRIRVLNL